jgi:tetratricopeptide (TPR) repeat protein
MGKFEKAEWLWCSVRETSADRLDLMVAGAWIAHEAANWRLATDRWRAVLAIDSANISAASCMVTALIQQELFAEAEASSTSLLQRFPGEPEILRVRAWIAHKRADWELAAERWQEVISFTSNEAAPYACLSTALRFLQEYGKAESALLEAIKRAPCSLIHQIEFAQLAHFRRDFVEGARRWKQLRERYAEDEASLGMIGFHEMQSSFELLDERARSTTDQEAREESYLSRELFMITESLGDNCEFGQVQRKYGAEPLGLLRFSSVDVDNLVVALKDEFVALGDPDTLRFEITPQGEYMVHDVYNINMHSFVQASEVSEQTFRSRFARRVGLLRRKLLQDIREGSKLFVFKSRTGMELADAVMLHRTLVKMGASKLLCVFLANADNPPRLCPGGAGWTFHWIHQQVRLRGGLCRRRLRRMATDLPKSEGYVGKGGELLMHGIR